MQIEWAIYFLIAIAGLLVFGKLLTLPFKLLLKLLINAILGIILLVITNILGANFGVEIGLNIVTILIAGFLGIPGVIFLIIFKYFL